MTRRKGMPTLFLHGVDEIGFDGPILDKAEEDALLKVKPPELTRLDRH